MANKENVYQQDIKKEIERDVECYLEKSESEYLDLNEAARFIKVSKSTMQKLSCNRLLPVYKPAGGKVYFKKGKSLDEISRETMSAIQEGGNQ
ncbi:MAG TPA: helix-turn-helix domain-containing protein [Chitinophagaceae bacterium]